MPSLSEDMYCSEQICIPPTYPYLLRQFAKAAIRSQPSDLLRWSTAYFRCLSLNIPPPVKPRLEYPIPRTHYGITPGWLKALLCQLPKTVTVDFKVLWDRWIGACLEHHTLIQILCLGGFTDPLHIPWLQFLGLCAAHLTDDLTHSMILICDIFTEEPEGGSSMIPYDTFIDVYKFLAGIDASKDQILKNYYFTDSLLGLWKEKVEKFKKEIEFEAAIEESTPSTVSSESVEVEEEKKKSMDEVISCPSIDQDVAADYLEFIHETGEIAEEIPEESEEDQPVREDEKTSKTSEEDEDLKVASADDIDEEEKELQAENLEEENLEVAEAEEDKTVKEKTSDVGDLEVKDYESADTLEGKPEFSEDKGLLEDLERLKALQQEMAGETDDELEKYKCQLMADMPMTSDQQLAIQHFEPTSSTEVPSVPSEKYIAEEMAPEDQGIVYEEVFVPRIPGIDAKVGDDIVLAVEEYMKKISCQQEGMVMPRNIRHYTCPPLEPLRTEG